MSFFSSKRSGGGALIFINIKNDFVFLEKRSNWEEATVKGQSLQKFKEISLQIIK